MSRKGLVAASLVLLAGARLAHGQPAGSEFQANTFTTNDQRRAAVGVFSNGDFVVTWHSNPQPSPAPPSTGQDGDSAGIFAQRFDSTGGKVGPEFQVNTYTTGGQFLSSVAVDPSTDGFVIVWMGRGPGDPDYGIFARLFDSSGTPAYPEFLVNTYTTGSQGVPRAAADASGNFVVVWQSQQDGGSGYYGSYGIFGQRFGSTGTPVGSEFQVNTYTTGYQSYAHVAMNAAGDFVVVWQSNYYDNPSASQDGSYAGVFARRFDSSGSALDTPEFQVNSTTTGYQYRPTVAVDVGSGGFVVAWSGYTSAGGYGVSGNRIYGCHPFCPPSGDTLLETSGGSSPALAADSAGEFVVVWQSNHDGDGSGVFGQRFYGTFYPIGGEFQVNAHVTGNQRFPAIGMNANGDAAVAWTSGSARRQFTPPGPTQDGDRDGIFGQVCPASDTTSPTVAVRSPIGAATLYSGMAYTITWTAADNCSLSSFDVLVSLDGGGTFPITPCSGLPGTARSCVWTVPLAATTTGRVRVVAQDASSNSGQDDSNANFKIVGGTPSVTVTAPNSPGPSWPVGSTKQIKWQHNLGKGELVRIEVNRNYPSGPWNIVTEAAPSTGPSTGIFDWVVTPFFGGQPSPGSTTARIRITALGHATVTDDGDVNFTITSRVQVTVPNVAHTWTIGTTKTIKWTHNYGANHTFNIQIDRDSTTGGGFEGIASNVLGTGSGGSFKWVVTGDATTRARIRVMKVGDGRGFDISDVDFEIAP